LAWSTGRIVLTEVKGFGEWVFAHNVTDISVLLLRYHHKEQDHIILKLLKTGRIVLTEKGFGEWVFAHKTDISVLLLTIIKNRITSY
jgi:hypothetical protein